MDSIQKVLMMYTQEGKSRREIAKMTGIHRETVGKYIKNYEEKRQELLEAKGSPADIQALIDALTTAPKYTVGNRSKRKLSEEIVGKIQAHLDENKAKRGRGLHKQQKKVMDIFEALEADSVDISYSTVLRTVQSLERRPKEAYIKALYEPGDICEFDWGEVKLNISGKIQTLQMAVFTTAYGNYRFAYLFTKQTTECFQEAHALFFQHIGGVYKTMVYDNMKVAVKRFVGTDKEPTQGLLQLSLYYGFGYRFCNVRSGNEKGHVERSVEVVRRKAFAFRDVFDSLDDANEYLLHICRRRNQKQIHEYGNQSAEERLDEEHPFLLPSVPLFDAARVLHGRVDKYATIMVDQNRYSVPDDLVGESLLIKVYATQVICFHQETKVAEHSRLTGSHEWRMDVDHYLGTLQKKPGAFAGSAAWHQAPQKIKKIYASYYTKREKDFIQLLQYIRDGASFTEVEKAIQELQSIHPGHVTTDKIKVLCAKNREAAPVVQATLSETGREIAARAAEHLRMYDDLFSTGESKTKEGVA